MASAVIAVDPAKLSNGCLEVLKGSHHLGRLDHSLAGDQSGADPARVKVALEQFEKVAVELEPGDTFFSLQLAPLFRSKPFSSASLGNDLLLQRR